LRNFIKYVKEGTEVLVVNMKHNSFTEPAKELAKKYGIKLISKKK